MLLSIDSAFLELFVLTLKTLSLLSGNGQVKVHLIYEAKIVFHHSISQDVLLLCHEAILLLCHEASWGISAVVCSVLVPIKLVTVSGNFGISLLIPFSRSFLAFAKARGSQHKVLSNSLLLLRILTTSAYCILFIPVLFSLKRRLKGNLLALLGFLRWGWGELTQRWTHGFTQKGEEVTDTNCFKGNSD